MSTNSVILPGGQSLAHVDIFHRVWTTHEGDECDLVQVTIYREGRPDDLLRFDDKGSLVRQAYRPVFEAAVTYEPATGGIEVTGRARASVAYAAERRSFPFT
jgi:hypothetical protein